MYVNPAIKRKLTRNEWFVIVSNLIPVYGVWFLGWSAVEVFIVYALETIIIGVMTVLKLAVATFAKGTDAWYNQGNTTQVGGLFFIFFFIAHYGLFAAVQTSIFSASARINPQGSGLLHFFLNWYKYVNTDIAIMLGVFVVSYFWRNFIPFVRKKEYQTVPMMMIMFQPYGRVFVQQFVVIVGSMFLGFGFDKGFIFIFAMVKIFFEAFINFQHLLDKSMEDLQKGNSSGK